MASRFGFASLIPLVLEVNSVDGGEDTLIVTARSTAAPASCPLCGVVSHRVQSHDVRQPSDLLCAGRRVRPRLLVRRFRCGVSGCLREVFAERFDTAVLAERARRTGRLEEIVHHLGLAMGGRPGAGFAQRLMLPVSNDTLLRVVRRRALPRTEKLTVIGIDDWAFRRNHRYVTIICDLEPVCVVALLPDREHATACAFRRLQPSIPGSSTLLIPLANSLQRFDAGTWGSDAGWGRRCDILPEVSIMSLRPEVSPAIPDETVRVARASFPKGGRTMRLRDELGAVFDDAQFAGLFPTRGRPAEAPWRLALVTLFQFAEGLPDRQAAEAVRGRIDWKYALALSLTDPGFDSTVLSEFRSRLVEGGAEQVLLDAVLRLARERNLLSGGGRQRTDSTHVLAAVRALNRLECVTETMRNALESLAVAAPDWLRVHARPDWAERYGHRAFDDRLAKNAARRDERARTIGQDGHALLAAALDPAAPGWLRLVPAVEILRRVWVQQFYVSAEGVSWRMAEHGIPPSSIFLSSPYDSDAHLGRKRTTKWIGYKAHLTETCDEGKPHLITHVQTMAAPVADAEATTPAHTALQAKGLLPAMHLVDTGYLDAELLVTTRRDFGIDLAGPARADERWQAREGKGFAAANFNVDWERKKATCPQGAVSASWTPALDNRGTEVIKVKFASSDCGVCQHLTDCTRGARARRSLTLRRHEQHIALVGARRRETMAEFAALSAVRAGVEGTISQAVRGFGLRRSRYVGQAKTHLQHVATAAAMNLVRIAEWLGGTEPATTRRSKFRTLVAQAA